MGERGGESESYIGRRRGRKEGEEEEKGRGRGMYLILKAVVCVDVDRDLRPFNRNLNRGIKSIISIEGVDKRKRRGRRLILEVVRRVNGWIKMGRKSSGCE